MKCKAIKDFPFAKDGFTTTFVKAGKVDDFGAATSSLMKDDFIEPAEAYVAAQPEKKVEEIKTDDVTESVEEAKTDDVTEATVEVEAPTEKRGPGRPRK